MVELAEEYGIKYWDLNIDENVDINWNVDTSDKGGHMNVHGAKIVTDQYVLSLAY